jgi:high-affinity nickel-transport protein
MTLVDSLDSILMLYAYAPMREDDKEGRFSFFYQTSTTRDISIHEDLEVPMLASEPLNPMEDEHDGPSDNKADLSRTKKPSTILQPSPTVQGSHLSRSNTEAQGGDYAVRRKIAAKASTMSSLSISLTLLSIIVAFW